MATESHDLFIVESITHTNGAIKADLSINPGSSIFKGHFPGQPVVPGACMVQVVKEVLESALQCPIQLKKAGNLKFIGMIEPRVSNAVQLELTYKIEGDLINVSGKLTDGDRLCFKINGVFVRLA